MTITLLYHNIWLLSSLIFCVISYAKWHNSNGALLLSQRSSQSSYVFLYCVIFTFWIGFRPLNVPGCWADTGIYARIYWLTGSLGSSQFENYLDEHSDILFSLFTWWFSHADISAEVYFFVCEIIYTFGMFFAIQRMFKHNQWIVWLFCISSFSFFSYSYNGVRNGMACSIVLIALSYFIEGNKKSLFKGLVCSTIAIGIHKSTTLPIASILTSMLLGADTKWAIRWWLFSILLSLFAGNTIMAFFSGIGFDDRLSGYTTLVSNSEYADYFSSTGFRWDFVAYSIMPIWLSYYIRLKKYIIDRKYTLLINCYILSNSFWIMVIQSINSNRFAYLSWFMYPIVIAYPLLKLHIWNCQDKVTMNILMCYVGFTVFLNVIYW